MTNNPILTYLPPGWTEDKNKNATDQDYDALTEEQLQKVMDRRVAVTHAETFKWFDEKNAKRIARGAAPIPYPHGVLAAEQSNQQQQSSQQSSQQADRPDPATENLSNLIKHVDESELEIFGFVLFRTHDPDEETWDAFEKCFYELLDEGVAAVPASSGFNRLDDKVFMRIVADESLNGQPPEGVARAYRLCMEQEDEMPNDDDDGWGDEVEPGLTTSMCLMVDEECVQSVLNRSTKSTAFVKAVDATLGAGETLEYEGVIKVAVTSLIPAFYAALLVYTAADVASKVSDDSIWRNIGPWDSELDGRRALKLIES